MFLGFLSYKFLELHILQTLCKKMVLMYLLCSVLQF